MSRPSSTYDIEESLSPTDREDFSIFLRYPEIDFDRIDERSIAHSSATLAYNKHEYLESSPLSTAPSTDHRNMSLVTDSTAYTTPAQSLPDEQHVDFGGWNEFIYLMQKSNLPQESLQYLTSLGQTILNIGTILYSTLRPNQRSSILRIGRWLISSIDYSSKQTDNQLEAIENLRLLVAFNVKPHDSQVWSTYRQRAKLIAKNISLPSKSELKSIKSLVSLCNAYVYRPFLNLHPDDNFGKQTICMVNDIHDKLTIWLQKYRLWCKGIEFLRTEYMQPLIYRLSRSETAKEEVRDFEQRVKKAKSLQSGIIADGVYLMAEQVVDSLNLSARRPGPGAFLTRSKTRYKREHTF